jgi:hypothetical protein
VRDDDVLVTSRKWEVEEIVGHIRTLPRPVRLAFIRGHGEPPPAPPAGGLSPHAHPSLAGDDEEEVGSKEMAF